MSFLLTASTALVLLLAPCDLEPRAPNRARCHRAYVATRLAATLVPSYVTTFDGGRYGAGIAWELAFALPGDRLWSPAFALDRDVTADTAAAVSRAFDLSLAAGLLYLVEPQETSGRLALRIRLLSVPVSGLAVRSVVHVHAGIGGYWEPAGVGPRLELRFVTGHLAWGGAFVAGGYQPNTQAGRHRGDLSIGFTAPWVWWW